MREHDSAYLHFDTGTSMFASRASTHLPFCFLRIDNVCPARVIGGFGENSKSKTRLSCPLIDAAQGLPRLDGVSFWLNTVALFMSFKLTVMTPLPPSMST